MYNPEDINQSANTGEALLSDNEYTQDKKGQSQDPETMPRDGLNSKHVAAYSVGHFNNDLCAAMWFVYLSWYIKDVVKLDPTLTASCLLSGQIADGITTPIVGVASDKLNTRWGKRMPWYVFGVFFVIPCFAGIFAYPEFVNQKDEFGNIKDTTF